MKVAVCFHLGYQARFDEFTHYIDNIIMYCPNVDIYITYRESDDPTQLCKNRYPQAYIMKADRGADTGAFLLQIKQLLSSGKHYDYVFKIHTKSNNPLYSTWVNELLDGIAGSPQRVGSIFKTFYDKPQIGMICSKKWLIKRNMTKDVNYPIVKNICDRIHVSMDGHMFNGGTIFWIRMSILRQVFTQVDLDKEYSMCAIGKPDEPSQAHGWERVYGLIVHSCDYGVHGV